jgi:predicted N-acyltransferase
MNMAGKAVPGGIEVRVVGELAAVDPAAWDALHHGASPFLKYGFLRALEDSGSIDRATVPQRPGTHSGWTSLYILAERGGALVGGVAAFIKAHSYGEYIFDWGWANAANRAGIAYYPKLVVAAPLTPATGPRLLVAEGSGPDVYEALIAAVRAVADDAGCSSIHWLFCTRDEQEQLARSDFFGRTSLQFHWKNRNYANFDGFLGELKSRKRKQLRKERQRAQAAMERLSWVSGRDATREQLDDLDRFYRNTTEHHGGQDYLRPGFFHRLAQTLPDEMQIVEVIARGQRIAGALFLETPQALYGRYWGATERVDLLHFETAYYAGIERAIEHRLPLFEAGAQGEHKLLRGFEPSATYSAHWIRHPGLAAAVCEYTERERRAKVAELAELAKYGPYR